jgi:hypothetical protein
LGTTKNALVTAPLLRGDSRTESEEKLASKKFQRAARAHVDESRMTRRNLAEPAVFMLLMVHNRLISQEGEPLTMEQNTYGQESHLQ